MTRKFNLVIVIYLLLTLIAISSFSQNCPTSTLCGKYPVKIFKKVVLGVQTDSVGLNQSYIDSINTIFNNLSTKIKDLEYNLTPFKTNNINVPYYVVHPEDNNTTIIVDYSSTCTINLVPLPKNFRCFIIRAKGNVKFTGYGFSTFNYRTIQYQYGIVTITSDGVNNYINGNIKL